MTIILSEIGYRYLARENANRGFVDGDDTFRFHQHPTIAIDVHEFLSTSFQAVRMTNQSFWEQNCLRETADVGEPTCGGSNMRRSDEGD
jgi:hypothetical protein